MRHSDPGLRQPMEPIPTFRQLPGPIYFRQGAMEPTDWGTHSHPWGQFNFVAQGVMEMKIEGEWMVSPPHYALWIPPGVAHYSRNRSVLAYRSAYLSPALSRRLPTRCRALEVTPLLRELLHELARQGVTDPQTPGQRRMAVVVIDQIINAAVLPSFLPIASSDALKQVMAYVEKHLSTAGSVAEIAQRHHMSVRKLERMARSELGMSLGDWRGRVKFVRATEALCTRKPISRIAEELGYSGVSAFAEMFKRHAQCTPDQYRKQHRAG